MPPDEAIRRSAVEDPDMGLHQNQTCRTLRVPTYEMAVIRRSAVEDSDICVIDPYRPMRPFVGRRSKTPTWDCAETEHVGLCEYRPTK
jgi:hypothetical protein